MVNPLKIGRRNVFFQLLRGRQFFERKEFLALRHDQENGDAVITITDTVSQAEQLTLAAEQALMVCREECGGHPVLDDCGISYTMDGPLPGIPLVLKGKKTA